MYMWPIVLSRKLVGSMGGLCGAVTAETEVTANIAIETCNITHVRRITRGNVGNETWMLTK